MRLITAEQATDLFGIESDTVEQLAQKNDDGLYDSTAIVKAFIHSTGADAADLDRNREHALLTRAKRQGLQLHNDLAEGKQVANAPIFEEIANVMSGLSRDFEVIRMRIISKYPATSHHVLSEIDRCQREIQNRAVYAAQRRDYKCS